jgi:hypothetical protein
MTNHAAGPEAGRQAAMRAALLRAFGSYRLVLDPADNDVRPVVDLIDSVMVPIMLSHEDAAVAAAVAEALTKAAASLDTWAEEMADTRYHADHRDWIACHDDELAAHWLQEGARSVRAEIVDPTRPAPGRREG